MKEILSGIDKLVVVSYFISENFFIVFCYILFDTAKFSFVCEMFSVRQAECSDIYIL